MSVDLPTRTDRPETTDTNPHSQLTLTPPKEIHEELARRMFALPDTEEKHSRVSIPGTRALVLNEEVANGPPEAFLSEREFCHIHSPDDGSLHMALPRDVVEAAKESGWAENHPVAELGLLPMTVVLVYGPRTVEELDVVFELVEESYRFARGESDE